MAKVQHHGFTLLELLIVLSIAGLLTSLAVPQFQQLLARLQFDHQAQTLINQLHAAAHQAQHQRTPVELTIHSDQIRQGQQVLFQHNRIRLHWHSPQLPQRLQFYPDGSNSGGQLQLQQGNHIQRVRLHWLTGEIEAYGR